MSFADDSPSAERGGVTELLLAFGSGDRAAVERLLPLVYDELRRIASGRLRGEGAAETLQTTALVNEAYIRLVASPQVRWESRSHFFAVAAQAMRHILVDRARERCALKRGGGARSLSLAELDVASAPGAASASADHADRVLAVDAALTRLEAVDRRLVSIVELRFFVGLTLAEVADTLAISPAAAWREWSAAKAFLAAELGTPSAAS